MEDIKTNDEQHEYGAKVGHGVPGLSKDDYLRAQQATLETTTTPWQAIRGNPRVMATMLSVQTLGFILGLEYVLLGALVGNQAFCRTMGTYDAATDSYSVDAWKLSLWAGVFGIMQFAGQVFAGFVSDRFGRRVGLYTTILACYIGVTVEIVSQNYKDYTGAKVIMGAATGMLQVVCPTYVAEVTPKEIRGITVGLFAFALSLGALIGNLVTFAGNQAFPSASDNSGWRVPLYVGLAVPTLSLILFLFLLVESPYWLVLKGKNDRAAHSIRKLFPHRTPDEVQDSLNLLVYTVEKEQADRAAAASTSYLDCLRGTNLRRTFVAAFPSLAQQVVGNQLVQSYSTYFFTLANISNSLAASSLVSALGLVGAIVAFFIIERKVIGRFWLVFFGVASITVCMFGIGIINLASHSSPGKGAGYGLVFFVALFNLAVTVGPGVAGWAYAGETGSVRLRVKTASLATGVNAIVGAFWNVVLPFELTAIGATTGMMFGGLGVICTAIVWFYIPDLTGRTFAEIDELFERRIPARKFSTTVCTGSYGDDEAELSA
ncbi:hypothetical protein Q5752_004386 [Cryptotrichosporon argae]